MQRPSGRLMCPALFEHVLCRPGQEENPAVVGLTVKENIGLTCCSEPVCQALGVSWLGREWTGRREPETCWQAFLLR